MTIISRKTIDDLAIEVRKTVGVDYAPVDLEKIADHEDIALAGDSYGHDFSGRLEFHHNPGIFILFYEIPHPTNPPSKVRFTLAHELGHYFLPEHREALTKGYGVHYCKPGFISNNEMEREADIFAASLLLPSAEILSWCKRKGDYTLKELLDLAAKWQTSATCTAIRYTHLTSACCAMILSKENKIITYVPSDDADQKGFRWIGNKTVPSSSMTAKVTQSPIFGQIQDHSSHSSDWFSERKVNCDIWEEAFPLGYTGLILTMLTFFYK